MGLLGLLKLYYIIYLVTSVRLSGIFKVGIWATWTISGKKETSFIPELYIKLAHSKDWLSEAGLALRLG